MSPYLSTRPPAEWPSRQSGPTIVGWRTSSTAGPCGWSSPLLWAGAFARGTATYWVGRGVRAGGSRSRWAAAPRQPRGQRAEGWVRRFGAPAVTLGFLTVGVQTAINASAGMLRMPQRRFLPAVTLGAALWSLRLHDRRVHRRRRLARWRCRGGGPCVAVGRRRGDLRRCRAGSRSRPRREPIAPVGPAPTAPPHPPEPTPPPGPTAGLPRHGHIVGTGVHMLARRLSWRPGPAACREPHASASVRGPPTRAPASGRPADDRPQHRKRDLS